MAQQLLTEDEKQEQTLKGLHQVHPQLAAEVASGWPMTHILKRYAEHQRCKQAGQPTAKTVKTVQKPVVLVTTGAYNPPHVGHLVMMQQAKCLLEDTFNKEVLGGFLSPSHTLYVSQKCRAQGIPCLCSEHRIRLTQMLCRDLNWLECGTWEATSSTSRWPDFPEVVQNLHQALAACNVMNVEVVYVCGTDHFVKCQLQHGLGIPHTGVAVISRQTDGQAVRSIKANPLFNVYSGTVTGEGHLPPPSKACLSFGAALALIDSISVRVPDQQAKPPLPAAESATASHAVESHPQQSLHVTVKTKGLGLNFMWTSSTLMRHAFKEGSALPKAFSPSDGYEFLTVGEAKGVLCPPHRKIYLSLTQLMHGFHKQQANDLENGLFLFGSKRMWVFPDSDEARAEARVSGPYARLPSSLRDLIVRKEQRGEVCFLKADEFGLASDYGGTSRCDYDKASAWLQSLIDPVTGKPYPPLQTDPGWWNRLATALEHKPRAQQLLEEGKQQQHVGVAAQDGNCTTVSIHQNVNERFCIACRGVAQQLEHGAHNYQPLITLLEYTHPTLHPSF
eukprot:m.365274 g.365274  ORF g.365274 m.365274 type:complete len:561 (-) comp30684_c0_seq1:182-1864(-)